MSPVWLFVLVGVGAFCMGAGVALVRLVGRESHEGKRT